jgi:hypothetical protein
MPDFTPAFLTGSVAGLERFVEQTPGINRFCAHNVILVQKQPAVAAASVTERT